MASFDFSDINLDFLESTPPKRLQGTERIDTPTIKCDLNFGKKGKSKKHSEWAKKIAKADELIREINKLKCEKLELQTQLKDFQKSALSIQSLYTTEKNASDQKSQDIQLLQEKFEQADSDLTVKALKCDQMEAQLAIHKDRPVEYNILVIKYLRLLNKLDEEECMRNFADRLMSENLREYCAKYKLKAPPAACTKQPKARRLLKEDAAVQCEILKDMPIAVKPAVRSQSTQCQSEMRSQGSQHISTMTTRGTTTACFIKYRTVGTSFPESQLAPVVDEILREFAPWQNITPISPLTDHPGTSDRPGHNVTKTFKSVGTCTWLCNIRRTIDFMPRSKQQRTQNTRPASTCDVSTSQSIKQEVSTPSPSPTPNLPTSVPSNQNNNVTAPHSTSPAATHNQSIISNPLFSALQSSLPLRHLSESSFDGLWHIFGRMLLGLLQTSNAGIATNAPPSNQESVNQHQFYSWLRELYDSSATVSDTNRPEESETLTATNVGTSPTDLHTSDSPTTVPVHSETLAPHTAATSPLRFNQTSPFGSPNIVRPQPRRSYAGEAIASQEDIAEDVMQPYVPTNCESNLTSGMNQTQELSTSEDPAKNHKKKRKHKILYEIEGLFPEVKLSKAKRKAVKRLLKTRKQKNNISLKDKKIESIASNNCSNNMGHEEETAVDFLKSIFESSNSTSQSHKMDEIQVAREVNTHKDLWNNRKDGANNDVKHSVEIVRVESIRNYEIDTQTNSQAVISDHLPNSEIQQLNNTVDVHIDDSINFKKPKNVHKNFSLCKKSNITNKKELYASLFGDSDTELDDTEYALEGSESISEHPNNLSLSESETSGDEDEFNSSSFSQNVNFGNTNNPTEELPTCSKNVIVNKRVPKSSLAVNKSKNNMDAFHFQNHNFDVIDRDLHVPLSPSHNISIPEISTPVLKTIEMSLMNEPATNFLFGQIDKETHERLETIIDKQLMEVAPLGEDAKAAREEIPSDFEKDFELSSEEDDNIASETIFLAPRPFVAKEIYTESPQRTTSSDLENRFGIITYKKGDVKDGSEKNTNGNTIRKINSSHPIACLKNGDIESCKQTKNSSLQEKCDYIEDLKVEKSENMSNIFSANGVYEIKHQAILYKDSRSVRTNNPIGNSCDGHVDIVLKNNSTSMVGHPTDESASALTCSLAPAFNTSIQSVENMSATQSEDEISVIEVSSDITSMNMSNENKLAIHGSPGGDSCEKIETIRCQPNTLGSVSNNAEMSSVMNLEDLRNSYTFLTEASKIKESVLGFPLEDEISGVKMLADNTDMEETSRNKTTNSNAVEEKESPQSLEHFVSISPSISVPKVSEVNSFGFEIPTRCEQDILSSSTDEEISLINISSDNTSIENEMRGITTTPNDELIIDDGSDETDEEKQDIEPEVQNTSKTNANSEIPQQYQNQSTEINSENGKSHSFNDNNNTSTEISLLLNSRLYKQILSDSLLPLVDDVLRDDEFVMETSTTLNKKPQTRGRKRKSECPLEEQPPCKRSERLRARKNNLSVTPVEIGKYTRVNRSSMSDMPSKLVETDLKKEDANAEYTKVKEINPELPVVSMGFFRETSDSGTEERLKTDGLLKSLQDKRNAAVITAPKNNLELRNIPSPITKDISSTFLSPLLVKSSTTCLQKSIELREIHGNGESITNYGKIDEAVIEETVTPLNMQSKQTAFDLQDTTNLKQKSLNIETTSSNQATFNYSDSPLSPPPPEDTIETILNTGTFDIPLELSPQYRPRAQTNSLLENLIKSHYSPGKFKRIVTANSQAADNPTKRETVILGKYENVLKDYCCSPVHLDPDIMASKTISKLQQNSIEYPLLCCVILKIAKNAETSLVTESELPSIIQEMPPRHLCLSLQRLYHLLKHLTSLNPAFCTDLLKKIDSSLFNLQHAERLTLNSSLHLIQLYLMSCKLIEHELSQHPARMLIAKCLYFHAIKSISMIHEVLMWYPTAMPPKEDRSYDRSDALITVIQQLLMSTKYDMDKADVRGKSLLSKLRFEYHYQPFKPSLDETICNLVEKLKMSKFSNLSLAFSVLCKRMPPPRSENILRTHILPLANECFNQALKNTESDERISVILDIISKVVKPFPSDWDVEVYLNLFSRFLSNFNRAVVQESAVCSIIRLQRFGYVNCFHRLISFKPTFELSSHAQTMLKTFIHRKPLSFLTTITGQSRVNLS